MLQQPVMHDFVVSHQWALTTVSPLRRGVVSAIASGDFLTSLFQSLWCAALRPAVRPSSMYCGPLCCALMPLHSGATAWPPVTMVWRPSQWWVSLTIRCLVALLDLLPPVQGFLIYRLATWSLCEAHPFTCGHAHVLVWLVDQSTCGLVP